MTLGLSIGKDVSKLQIKLGTVMSKSPRVEVLTAEVRVLKVGNGQITRSMYRQLDVATFERFEPFGRVNDIESGHNERVLQVVGPDTETGSKGFGPARSRSLSEPRA
jgi:hypothetical protein